MKKLSKEKRKQFVMVVLATAMALGGIWFGLIKFQEQNLRSIAERKQKAAQKLALVKQTVENAEQIESQLCENAKILGKIEDGMASGDLYAWVITTVRQFKLPYKIEIPQFSQIDGPKDMNLLPNFPYKQASITVAGSAHFHEFGKFVSDFENQFPYMRVLNVSLEPASGLVSSDREKLAFKMEIVALVKPSTA